MDFLPLAIWAVGILFLDTLQEYVNFKMGVSREDKNKISSVILVFWFVGCIIFLILGIYSNNIGVVK